MCLVVLALSLRTVVGSLGAALPAIRDTLSMSATVGGILTTLPVLCFALVAPAANSIVRFLGLHKTAVASMLFILGSSVIRSVTDSTLVFIAASTVALAGAAVGNVILPALVKLHFPHRIGTASAIYSAALMAGIALSATLTEPVSAAFGSWRYGLVIWAIVPAVALLPWLLLIRHDSTEGISVRSGARWRAFLGSRLTWYMTMFFGIQTGHAYVQFGWLPEILIDSGLSKVESGYLLGVLAGLGVPLTLAMPLAMRYVGDRPFLPLIFGLATAAGWAGILIAPGAFAPIIWVILLGTGGTAFSWVLTVISHKTRSAGEAATLSSIVQGGGYLLASVAPFGTGFLHDATDSWHVPIMILFFSSFGLTAFGVLICRSPVHRSIRTGQIPTQHSDSARPV